jgi:hypothetical protein
MRNQHRVSLPVLFFIGVLIAPAGFAADKYDVSADEIFDPFGIMTGETIGKFVAEGTVNCPGHEPVLNPALPPCPEGSRTHIRNGVIETRVESDDPRVAGTMTVQMNANWNAYFEGPLFGTFTIHLFAGGTWAGTYEGQRVFDRTTGSWKGTLHVRGMGFGGSVDGMKMKAEDQLESIFPMPIAYTGEIVGWIMDPK